MIHVVDGLTDKIISVIDVGQFWDDIHYKSLRDTMETFDFSTFGDQPFATHLGKRNRLVIPDEDGRYAEFIIANVKKYRSGVAQFADVKANASYLDIRKAKVIRPESLTSQTLSTLVSHAIGGTEWQVGRLEGTGRRTIHIEDYTDPYSLLKTIATEYDLELQFRTEIGSNRIVGRYVDLLQRVGEWRGREVEFGHDLIGIERIEDTDNIVTALIGVGPERQDGTRLSVTVSDSDAWQRWGRVDPATGNRAHIIEVYEPQSEDQDMTLARLRTLTENELEKRVNAVISYKSEAVDLENAIGLENQKVRFGDSIRVKDDAFVPPIYLDARVHTMERSIVDKTKKTFVLGDFIEYTEDDINAIWRSMQLEIQRKLAHLIVISVESSAGDVFKNGVGTSELTARVFLSGSEVDEDASLYSYSWTKHDKDGNRDMSFARSGKTITVASSDVDSKATFFVDIGFSGEVIQTGQFTIADLFDGEDGVPGVPGPPGEDGQSLYTWVKYADSASGAGMSDSPVGKEYIGFSYNKTTATESTNPSDYSWALIQGPQGVQGDDGQTYYTWLKYADSPTSGMSDNPSGKKYMGLAYNKTTATESTNYADYDWSLIQGPQGERGPQGPNIVDSTTQIEANVIKSNHIDVSNLSAITANLGTVTAGSLTGVTITSSDGLGNKVVMGSGKLDSFRNNTRVASLDNTGLKIYRDSDGSLVGNIRDAVASGTSTIGLGIVSHQNSLSLGFDSVSEVSKTWMYFNYNEKSVQLLGSHRPGHDDGRLYLKSTGEGGTAAGRVPGLNLLNYTDSSSNRWSSVVVYTGRDNSYPTNGRYGFEVWQYRGTSNGSAKQMVKIDTDDSNQTYFSAYTDVAWMPPTRLQGARGQYRWAAQCSVSSALTNLHGDQNGPVNIFLTETSITIPSDTTLHYMDYNFSGAENIFHTVVVPYDNNSFRFTSTIYSQTSTGFRIYVRRQDTSTGSYTIKLRLMIMYEMNAG